jgi:hypothetical protein
MHNEADSPAPEPNVSSSDLGSPELGLPALDSLDDLLHCARWPDGSSDPLDRLLGMAQWPEPVSSPWRDVRQVARRARRRRAWVVVGVTSAAVLFMAFILSMKRGAGDKPSAGVPNMVAGNPLPQPASSGGTATRVGMATRVVTAAREAHQRPPAAEIPATEDPATEVPATSIVQADTPVYWRALPPGDLRVRMLLARSHAPSASEDDAVIDRLLAQRIADTEGDLQELTQPFQSQREELEQRLLERFGTFVGEEELAAVDLLGCFGSKASVHLVRRESLKSAVHVRAVRALLRIADTRALARLVQKEWDPDLREEILATLRTRDDKETVSFVLTLEGEPSCIESRLEACQFSDSF